MGKKNKKRKAEQLERSRPPIVSQTAAPQRSWSSVATVIGVLGGLAGIAALAPTVYQAWADYRQLQDDSKHPELTMSVRLTNAPKPDLSGLQVTFEVAAENVGNKEAPYFYWHLMVPVDSIQSAEYRHTINNAAVTPKKEIWPNNERWLHFQGHFDKPLPQIGMNIGNLALKLKPENPAFDLRWQITCCDDKIFPSVPDSDDPKEPKYGSISIDPTRLKRFEVFDTLSKR